MKYLLFLTLLLIPIVTFANDYDDLRNAVMNTNIEFIKNYHGNVNQVDETFGMTVLMWAASMGITDSIKALLEKGADANIVSGYGNTALLAASGKGPAEDIIMLIKAGAKVNAVDIYGQTALMEVSEFGIEEAIPALLEKGANVNAIDKNGSTALIHAIIKGNLNVIKTLIAAGANVNIADKKGMTAIMYANIHPHPDIVRILEENGANPDDVNKELLLAISSHNVDTVKEWLSKGNNPNTTTKFIDGPLSGTVPILFLAIKNKDYDIIELLLKNKANPNVFGKINDMSMPALDDAISIGDLKIINILFKYGADANIKDNYCVYPIHYALTAFIEDLKQGQRNLPLVETIINKTKNINIQDPNGFTPLHFAIITKNIYIIQLLLKKGASKNIPTTKNVNFQYNIPEGTTPLQLAGIINDINILDLLNK